jgi:branched-subunit amino acid permease
MIHFYKCQLEVAQLTSIHTFINTCSPKFKSATMSRLLYLLTRTLDRISIESNVSKLDKALFHHLPLEQHALVWIPRLVLKQTLGIRFNTKFAQLTCIYLN